MADGDRVSPFRWDVTQRSQLGSLPKAGPPETYPEFESDLLTCCTRLLAFAGDSDLVFVGRSPHAIFDLLSGLLLDTSWDDRLRLLNISLTYDADDMRFDVLERYLAEVGLDPRAMAQRGRAVALVDVVDTGHTFTRLIGILSGWAERERIRWDVVARQLRIVGLTWREKTSPKTWRWQQNVAWIDGHAPGLVKNVSLPYRLATFLAARAPKTSRTYFAGRWGDPDETAPWRSDEARDAVALALHLYDLGRNREWRLRFAKELARQPAMTEAWFRSLILEIKR